MVEKKVYKVSENGLRMLKRRKTEEEEKKARKEEVLEVKRWERSGKR